MLLRSNKYQESGGGININGTEVQYSVKSGVTINKGDFVQIDDTINLATIEETIRTCESYTLSDNRQITFYPYPYNSLYYTTLKARIDSISDAGIVTSTVVTAIEGIESSQHAYFRILELEQNKFLAIIPLYVKTGTTQNPIYFSNFQIYILTYNITTNEFSSVDGGVIAQISGYKPGSASSYTDPWPTIFIAKKLNSSDIFIVCSRRQSSGNDGDLTAYVYDFVNKNTKATLNTNVIVYTGRSNVKYEYDKNFLTEISPNRFAFMKFDEINSSTTQSLSICEALYIFTYNGVDTITYDVIPSNQYYFLFGIGSNKFINISGSSVTIREFLNNGTISTLASYTAPFDVYGALYFNGKYFIANKGLGTVRAMFYDPVTDDITFSDPSVSAIYWQQDIAINNSKLCTYQTDNRKTVRENNGSFYSYNNLQTIKGYVNRIDGIAADNGTGGNTITVIVPATN